MDNKICSKCNLPKPISYFQPQIGSADGYNAWCKDCHNRWRRDKYKRRKLESVDTPLVKICRTCKQVKSRGEFSPNYLYRDGLDPLCKSCAAQKSKRARNVRVVNQTYSSVSEKRCARCKATKPADSFYPDRYAPDRLRSVCRDCESIVDREMSIAHPERNRNKHLKGWYGITESDYNELLATQGGVCAICGQPNTYRTRNGNPSPLCVDHDHVTGKIRGLLCHACNNGLGRFHDNPELCEKAAAYLRKHSG